MTIAVERDIGSVVKYLTARAVPYRRTDVGTLALEPQTSSRSDAI